MKPPVIQTELLSSPLYPAMAFQEIHASGAGAVACFTGHVRGDDGVSALYLEHHPVLAAAQLEALAQDVAARWSVLHIIALHRIGHVAVGEAIVCIAVASAHRSDALDACAFLIDQCKTRIALWKQEILSNGATRWVDPRNCDHEKAAAWALGGISTKA